MSVSTYVSLCAISQCVYTVDTGIIFEEHVCVCVCQGVILVYFIGAGAADQKPLVRSPWPV